MQMTIQEMIYSLNTEEKHDQDSKIERKMILRNIIVNVEHLNLIERELGNERFVFMVKRDESKGQEEVGSEEVLEEIQQK